MNAASSLSSVAVLFALYQASSVGVAQQGLVIPTTYSTTDAPTQLRLPGTGGDLRLQILLGQAHLVPMAGHALTGLSFRRSASTEAFVGATSVWSIEISAAARGTTGAVDQFALNRGPNPTLVFSGPVSFPSSPAESGPAVAWTASNTVDIAFTQPYQYLGGPLCIDITGSSAQPPAWWMVDAAWDDTSGSAISVGTGCGIYGDATTHSWADVDVGTLTPGSVALFTAAGTPSGLAFMIIAGQISGIGIPLSSLGLPADAACRSHLHPQSILSSRVTTFGAPAHPLLTAQGGIAEASLALPHEPWMLSQTLACQWMDLQQNFAVSQAIQWTTSSALPGLDMAAIEGWIGDPRGYLTVRKVPVVKLTYQ